MCSIWNLNPPKCHWKVNHTSKQKLDNVQTKYSTTSLYSLRLMKPVHSGNTAAKFHTFISMCYFLLSILGCCFGGGRGNFRTTVEEALELETAPTWLLKCCNLQKFKTKSSDTDTSHSS